jgi:H+/gluconate symporter-like permease
MGVAGILVSLMLLMFFAYRGVSVIVLAPLVALLAVLFSGDTPLLASYTQIFMVHLGGFVAKYFPLFLLGALFGKLMEDSGSARVIAERITAVLGVRHAITAIVLACAVLTYGGVSLFVVVFVAYPLATEMFRAANVPKRLIPGAIALGSFTFSMSCLPGSTQIQNLIPMSYFGTTPFAAPGLGLLGAVLMCGGGLGWLTVRAKRAATRGEGYGEEARLSPGDESKVEQDTTPQCQSFTLAIAPLVAVIVLNFVFAEWVLPQLDTSYLSEAKYGQTELAKVRGIWSTLAAMSIAVMLTILLYFRSLVSLNQTLSRGAAGCMLPIFNTASEVGYGQTIASLPAFAMVKGWVLNIAPNNPLVSESISINILAGITGSASGGLSIALESLGEIYRARAVELGVSLELMHRVAAMSAGGLDTLPHNGAVITLLAICGLTHRQSYLDIAMVSLVVPILATAAVLVVGTFSGAF